MVLKVVGQSLQQARALVTINLAVRQVNLLDMYLLHEQGTKRSNHLHVNIGKAFTLTGECVIK